LAASHDPQNALPTESSGRIAVTNLVSDAALRIRWMPGTGTQMVVVFGGVQHNLGGVPMDEFAGSVSQGGTVHVVFVNDLNCTWYSAPGLAEAVVTHLQDLCRRVGVTAVSTLGNSMGGYGAVLFAHALGAQTALALSPQVSMDLAVIDEPRWQHFRPNFGPDLAPGLQVRLPDPPIEVLMVFGALDDADLKQAALLPMADNLHLYKVRGCGHDAVKQFKAAGMLRPLIQAGLAGDHSALAAQVRTFEQDHDRPVARFLRRVRRRLGG